MGGTKSKKMKQKQMCEICGESEVWAKGFCRRCYNRLYKRRYYKKYGAKLSAYQAKWAKLKRLKNENSKNT